jgi:hypothetical protein
MTEVVFVEIEVMGEARRHTGWLAGSHAVARSHLSSFQGRQDFQPYLSSIRVRVILVYQAHVIALLVLVRSTSLTCPPSHDANDACNDFSAVMSTSTALSFGAWRDRTNLYASLRPLPPMRHY